MSARSRGRQNPNQDADEERRLWKEVKDKAKDVDTMVVRTYHMSFSVHDGILSKNLNPRNADMS